MIKVFGDSHAYYCFKNIPGIFVWWIGPVTLKRVGYREDTIVQEHVNRVGVTADDLCLFLFGEIDVRAFIKPWHERHKEKMTLDEMLGDWVARYSDAISALDLKGAKRGLVSVPPPACGAGIGRIDKRFPVAGTDEERAEYVRVMNRHIAAECEKRGWPYIDVYSLYAGNDGMLPVSQAIKVHIADNRRVQQLMAETGLV